MTCFNPLDRGNLYLIKSRSYRARKLDAWFQSPRSGKFVSNRQYHLSNRTVLFEKFQSPRSGKFVSDLLIWLPTQMTSRFNPLDRGNLYLIAYMNGARVTVQGMFQSPRSGKFVSNIEKEEKRREKLGEFQSPRSGKFVCNFFSKELKWQQLTKSWFQSPRSGKFVSNLMENISFVD